MEQMNITSAQYYSNLNGENTSIIVSLEDQTHSIVVPLDPSNRHYAEILKQVADGVLTIAEAD